MTNSWYGNNKHVMFLKLRPELLKKKKKYIYIYIYIPKLSRIDICIKDRKQQDLKQRKRKPGKCCVMMFCNKNKCRRSKPSPVSSNPGCWTIHLASACNCPLWHPPNLVIVKKSSQKTCRPTVGRQSTDSRPTVYRQVKKKEKLC